jgi:hypothetical protein
MKQQLVLDKMPTLRIDPVQYFLRTEHESLAVNDFLGHADPAYPLRDKSSVASVVKRLTNRLERDYATTVLRMLLKMRSALSALNCV